MVGDVFVGVTFDDFAGRVVLGEVVCPAVLDGAVFSGVAPFVTDDDFRTTGLTAGFSFGKAR